ncbi:DUF3622 domain-containing protein [Neptuniibacter marinus]|uniref:DUF3622 domain-containing protein n=1 Tax=Neptuniibacter marinus TaxID=1806670 RepID=UPI000835D4EB|nr:DUF3622 domain-containing protein [Neptuniibacter marinus]
MAKGKKYDYQVVAEGETWSVKILRQASARRIVVSKRQDGFETEDEAKAWGESELKQFMEQQIERNKRKAERRVERDEAEEAAQSRYEEAQARYEASRVEDE